MGILRLGPRCLGGAVILTRREDLRRSTTPFVNVSFRARRCLQHAWRSRGWQARRVNAAVPLRQPVVRGICHQPPAIQFVQDQRLVGEALVDHAPAAATASQQSSDHALACSAILAADPFGRPVLNDIGGRANTAGLE